MKKPEKVAIAWLQGGIIKILKRKKTADGIVHIDKENAILIPDSVTPRLIRLINWIPIPSAKWYPLYLANPEHALIVDLEFKKGDLSFERDKSAKPIEIKEKGTRKIKINIAEAIPLQIKPIDNAPKNKDDELKYGLETMSAENLSTFLEGKQESLLSRTTSDKLNLIMFVAIGAVCGFLLGQVLPLAATAV